MIYFDYNATAPIKDDVLNAMHHWWKNHHANPSSAYQLGRQAKAQLEHVRQELADYLKVKDHEVIFTSGGTESNNLALFGLLNHQSPGHLIISSIEHSSVRQIGELLKQQGWLVDNLPVDSQGVIQVDELENLLTDRTALVSVMAANNETGVIQPIDQIGTVCQARGIPFHCDAAQYFGRLPIPWSATTCPDLVTLTSHKAGGPIGNGLLINRLKNQLKPIMVGGDQEYRLRPGTPFGSAIVGLGRLLKSFEPIQQVGDHEQILRDYLESNLKQLGRDIIIHGDQVDRLPNTTMLALPGFNASSIQKQLDEFDLAIGLGSACNTGQTAPSHVLKAMGLSNRLSLSSIRLSIGWKTIKSEIDVFLEKIKKILK